MEHRVRAKELLNRVTSPQEAASLVEDGMSLGIGTGDSIACPKTFFTALAQQAKGRLRVKLFTGGPVPHEVDGLMVEADAYERRFGQFSNAWLRDAANERRFPLLDTRTGTLPHQVRDGRFGRIDIALIEAAAITEAGYIVPTTSLLDAPSYAVLAEKVIVEINPQVPPEIEGIHDVYIPEVAPHRKPIPLEKPGDRIGTPYIPVNPERIAAIIESSLPDNPPPRAATDQNSQKIAHHLLEFFSNEVKRGRLPPNLLPLQFGVGAIPDAFAAELAKSSFTDIEFFTGTFGDGGLDLIDAGKAKALSTASLYLSQEGFQRLYRDLPRYKRYIVIRPVVLADCPELVARVGLIAMNSGIEVDIYGHVNSTHIQGSRIVSGIGGSCDFMWNAFLSVVLLSSTARRGAISCIVPMVTHVDHPEHAVDVIVTEQGLADLRGLAPVERARTIIANCAHPDYKPLLSQYLEEAINSRGGHEPHMLEKAFSFHLRFAETGSMKP
ncbi:MAG TPA: acetyl-CoA hydrolase [Dehalococcoidia bacterium]|nr:acetyl-CoA hydrolase [Dehalococcoidia bacterium]